MPERLPMFPLESVLLPGFVLPLHVFEERYRHLVAACLAGDGRFGVVLIERGREVGGGDERVSLGTVAVIEDVAELPGGRFALVCHGAERMRVVEWLPDDPYPVALVDLLSEGRPPAPESLERLESSVRRAWAILSELGADSPLAGLPAGGAFGEDTDEHGWHWCAVAPLMALDRLRLLEVDDAETRLRLACELVDAVAADAMGLLGRRASEP